MTDAAYKVSYVVVGQKHQGAIVDARAAPKVGDEVVLDGLVFQVTEVDELMPPINDFGFLHATCRFLRNLD